MSTHPKEGYINFAEYSSTTSILPIIHVLLQTWLATLWVALRAMDSSFRFYYQVLRLCHEEHKDSYYFLLREMVSNLSLSIFKGLFSSPSGRGRLYSCDIPEQMGKRNGMF